VTVPFRWNVARREQLGRLPDAPVEGVDPWHTPPPFGHLLRDLRECAACAVARAGDVRLVFVGRSLESVFDYLAGALVGTPWSERVDLLSVSIRGSEERRAEPAAREAFRAHLDALDLAPARIAAAPRPVAFVDLVHGGGTFGALSDAIVLRAREEGVDPAAVRRRLRWVGITMRSKNSPNTWRWFQRVPWASDYTRGALRGVSIEYGLWDYLGNRQAKTMPSNHAGRWGEEEMLHPHRHPEHLAALKLAHRIHERGRAPEERARFAALLARRPEMREPWLRSLVVALRR
jgi:hypothetical protein